MNKMQRKEQLDKVKADDGNIVSRDIPLRYHGESIKVDVYRIPLEDLVYNQYNGRIASSVKAYECRNHTLDPENDADRAVIEDLLWKSNKDRNDKTMKSLVLNGQLRNGIVTADGVIIDGNRRASLLNCACGKTVREKNHWSSSEVDKCRFFNAVILPESATSKDIQQLETTYQMGEDEKLDYNPIEKYLKCRDLIDEGFDERQIADMMDETETNVRKWLATLELMDDYLEHLGYEDMYPMLDQKEDQFLSLEKGLKDWRGHSALARADWEYEDTDIDDLKMVSFDYIRSDYEGKDFRRICKPSTEGSLFQNKRLWESFSAQHFDSVGCVEEESVGDAIASHPDVDAVESLRARDSKWKKSVDKSLKTNFKYSVRRLEDKLDDAAPETTLRKVRDLLDTIDTSQPSFSSSPDVAKLVSEINKRTYQLKKLLGQ